MILLLYVVVVVVVVAVVVAVFVVAVVAAAAAATTASSSSAGIENVCTSSEGGEQWECLSHSIIGGLLFAKKNENEECGVFHVKYYGGTQLIGPTWYGIHKNLYYI